MHKWAKQIMECVKTKVEAMGIDNIEGQHLEELEKWTEIAKNIVCYDKDYNIVEAMKKPEDNEDIMRMLEQYEDYPDRRFYDHYRYADGRFAPKGHGTYRRGYEEPPYMHMYPEAERMRDMDRDYGKMYYTEPMSESSYDRAKRNYTETKEMHKNNTPEDKEHKMKSLDSYTKELASDITGMVADMSAEEKNLLRTKLSTLVSKI
ncbi:MAG: hypothetical protein SO361_06175 [Lachnospira sp.]|nr:hypothetical protein [Lachnospira sp.]